MKRHNSAVYLFYIFDDMDGRFWNIFIYTRIWDNKLRIIYENRSGIYQKAYEFMERVLLHDDLYKRYRKDLYEFWNVELSTTRKRCQKILELIYKEDKEFFWQFMNFMKADIYDSNRIDNCKTYEVIYMNTVRRHNGFADDVKERERKLQDLLNDCEKIYFKLKGEVNEYLF